MEISGYSSTVEGNAYSFLRRSSSSDYIRRELNGLHSRPEPLLRTFSIGDVSSFLKPTNRTVIIPETEPIFLLLLVTKALHIPGISCKPVIGTITITSRIFGGILNVHFTRIFIGMNHLTDRISFRTIPRTLIIDQCLIIEFISIQSIRCIDDIIDQQ
ncbi:hypothetical protein Ddc_07476 [Ditylenchus destructor]|nr:hypothetical protein Ddc_07476 [Ditylenchus destructor]